MALLALAYPKLARNDFGWIEAHRAKHDPQSFKIVKPHFTLVFAVSGMSDAGFADEVGRQVAGVGRIAFTLNLATVSRDASGSPYHEFLVPERGYAAIVKLHDRLYGGRLAAQQRLDIDYVPHLAIGKGDDPRLLKERVDALNRSSVAIDGEIDSVEAVEHADGCVETLKRFELV